jgi:hypothetical protein
MPKQSNKKPTTIPINANKVTKKLEAGVASTTFAQKAQGQ